MARPFQADRFHLRWMIRRDLHEALEIESEAFEFPWKEADFKRVWKQKNCIAMVAELHDKVAGYWFYEVHMNRYHIINFAVAKEHRRRGIGTSMMNHQAWKLRPEGRNRIQVEVRETNVTAQVFFRSLGFRAVSTLYGYCHETGEDAYSMWYRCREEIPKNANMALFAR